MRVLFDQAQGEPVERLDSITVKGFKSIASIENLKLGAINVLIGANGSGKSNFIGAFQFLKSLREGQLEEAIAKGGGADFFLHFGRKVTSKMKFEVSFNGGVNQYVIKLEPTDRNGLFPVLETIAYWDKAEQPIPVPVKLRRNGFEAGISDEIGVGTALPTSGILVARLLERWKSFHFHDTGPTSSLKKTADMNDNHSLRADGSNLAAFLYLLRLQSASNYRLIQKVIHRVAPFFDDFVLEPLKLAPDKIRLEWKHKNSDAYFDVSALSDGTLRFIALATLFLQPRELLPSVILVDEPELGLHPYAITLLASLIKQASVHTQVIVSTQSPRLVDKFQPEDILVADRIDGGTVLTRQSSEKLAAWLEDYSLGELWEKNELGGRPQGI